ncbi:nickel-dependent hydrogenase large subunit [uncultured Paludibaculum sp.]|uniref:Ni/Fe hydrogenase subunit alpha n=1 Tax=uncultured Paludibaculum sp. TaxID=1765020 RepID=UPI002AABCD1C|nr:nickel-dependent hydrogenase large subunit [uncultured Paludibaculum sp.]
MTPTTQLHSKPGVNKIEVPVLARVEGEGALSLKVKNGRIVDLRLKIPEPPRLFEGFLAGRHCTEVPDITSRICGICPIAYQMSSIHALERGLGVEVHPQIRALRRLFYCGEWIESHVLHIYMLHAPDFLGCQDVVELAAVNRDAVLRALRMKKIGNHLVTVLGGREIHPVGACIGGFHRIPAQQDLAALVPDLEWALEASLETVKFAASLPCPDLDVDYEFVAVHHPTEYAMNEGRIVSNKGLDIEADEFEDHSQEQHVRHSNALHSVLKSRHSYLTGPLARFNLNFDTLPPVAVDAAVAAGCRPPVNNPFRGIIVRAVELVFACHEALRLISEYDPPPHAKVPLRMRAARCAAATEAPRGLLYHRYEVDAQGFVQSARIVPPTAQNLKRIEDDLWCYVPSLLTLSNDDIAWRAEQAIRNYDPCISCATHFLKLDLRRR